jgi:hypothetical protein
MHRCCLMRWTSFQYLCNLRFVVWRSGSNQAASYVRQRNSENYIAPFKNLTPLHCISRSFRRLQVLQLYIDLATFRKRRNLDLSRRNIHLIENGRPHYDFSANEAIGEFVWYGMETRISIAEVDLESLNVGGLWNDLGHCFGPSNVQWVPHGKDRYRGVVGDIVIKDEIRKLPGSSSKSQPSRPTPLASPLTSELDTDFQ